MLTLIKLELKKILKLKQIYLSFIGAIFFSLIIFINYIGTENVSAFTPPIATLGNLTQTFIIVVFLGFGSYTYGLEIEHKTLKILYSRAPEWKFILAKFITGIIYIFILLYTIGIIVLLISIIFYPQLDFSEFKGDNLILATQGFKYIFLSYFFQGISLIFVLSLSITLSIIFNSTVISVILTFFLMLCSFIAGNLEFIRPILPTTYWLIWQDIMKQNILWSHILKSVGILILYSFVLYLFALYFYKSKDVTI